MKIGNLVIDALKKKLHDFELSHFKCTFLERKHNASDKQYLDKYHWIDVVLDPHIVQLPKPVKGFSCPIIWKPNDIIPRWSVSSISKRLKYDKGRIARACWNIIWWYSTYSLFLLELFVHRMLIWINLLIHSISYQQTVQWWSGFSHWYSVAL